MVRRTLGDKWGIANSLNGLADLLLHQGALGSVRALLDESLALNLEIGDQTAIAYCLEDYAGLAAGCMQPDRALRLSSSAVALREAIGAPLPPAQQIALDRLLEPARRALSEAEQSAAWEQGRAMTIEQAIDYALARA